MATPLSSDSIAGSTAGSITGAATDANAESTAGVAVNGSQDLGAGLPAILDDFDLNPPMDALEDILSQDGNVFEEDELMADLGVGSSGLSEYDPMVGNSSGSVGLAAAAVSSGGAWEASEAASFESALRALRKENARLFQVVASAPMAKERQDALQRVRDNRKAIEELLSYRCCMQSLRSPACA